MRDQFISHHNLSAWFGDEPTSVNICERLQIDISGSKQRTLRFDHNHLLYCARQDIALSLTMGKDTQPTSHHSSDPLRSSISSASHTTPNPRAPNKREKDASSSAQRNLSTDPQTTGDRGQDSNGSPSPVSYESANQMVSTSATEKHVSSDIHRKDWQPECKKPDPSNGGLTDDRNPELHESLAKLSVYAHPTGHPHNRTTQSTSMTVSGESKMSALFDLPQTNRTPGRRECRSRTSGTLSVTNHHQGEHRIGDQDTNDQILMIIPNHHPFPFTLSSVHVRRLNLIE